MAKVEIINLNKSYDKKNNVLNDINFTVKDKEFLTIVGPSGCGKTTLLRTVAGLETVDSGEIRIDEKKVNDLDPKDRDIAMVFQSYALYPHLNVFDNIAFGLKLRKTPKAEIKEKVINVAKKTRNRRFAKEETVSTFGRAKAKSRFGACDCKKSQSFFIGRAFI